MANRKSFVMYTDYLPQVEKLTDEQAENIILAVNDAIAKKKKAREETA